MRQSASITRISFSFLLLNLRWLLSWLHCVPVFARQESQETLSAAPEVQVPTDPPSLPAVNYDASADKAMPKVPPPVGRPTKWCSMRYSRPYSLVAVNWMFRRAEESRPAAQGQSESNADLQQLAQRMKSITQLTQSAQALFTEAQH